MGSCYVYLLFIIIIMWEMQSFFCDLVLEMNDNNSLKKTKDSSSIIHRYSYHINT